MRNKSRREILEADMEIIVDILRKKKKGMLSLDIASIAGFSSKKTRQLLVALRTRKKVYCEVIDPSRNVRLWTTQDVSKSKKASLLYPDLDAQHEEWRKQVIAKKPIYNPWGRQ